MTDERLWLDEDPPTWNFPEDTPPHVLAGLRRLFSRPSLFTERPLEDQS